jgi:hypothetical protein
VQGWYSGTAKSEEGGQTGRGGEKEESDERKEQKSGGEKR